MRQRRMLIGLLLLASVLVDCAAVTAAGRPADLLHSTAIFAWALQVSQVSLVAIWLALGRTPAPLRLMATVAVVAMWAWALDELLGFPAPREWNVVLTAQAVAVSAPLLVGRWLGLSVVDTSPESRAPGRAATLEPRQFSIAYLLGWMTALAVTLSAMQCATRQESMPLALLMEGVVVGYLLGRGALAWAVLWVGLGRGWLGVRIGALGAAGAVALAAFAAVPPGFAGGFRHLLGLILLEVVLLLGSLAVFRAAGYRLSWGRGS